jgi:hypothetical protein
MIKHEDLNEKLGRNRPWAFSSYGMAKGGQSRCLVASRVILSWDEFGGLLKNLLIMPCLLLNFISCASPFDFSRYRVDSSSRLPLVMRDQDLNIFSIRIY